ncbi:MAG: ATP-binding protein [Bryobacterales bacterium]|nr:ATP-binding protein [Bryobacterales bacterium]
MTLLEAGGSLDAAEMREFFRIIVEQANQTRGLISNLLEAGRIGTGTLAVAPEPTGVAELVKPARRAFLSGGQRHEILIDLPTGLSRVMADRRRIVQVLGNLFANAARYGLESSPIRVSAAPEQLHVAVSVSDEGRGVAREQLPHLFRMRVRNGEVLSEGHGLGLAICKGLVEAHGGRIRVASAGPGRGTTFTFTIPAAAESGGAASSDPAATPLPDSGRE